MNTLQQQQTKLEGQAKQALGAGREDLAREALSRRATLQTQYATWRPSTTRSRPTRRS